MTPPGAFACDLQRYRSLGVRALLEPSLWAIAVYRLGQLSRVARPAASRYALLAVYLPLFAVVTLVTGIYLPRGARIGGGLRIWHFGGVFLHPKVVIGANCTLRQGVTIGDRRSGGGVPVLGNNVDVGAGAKILGALSVGDDVCVGANAVVLQDVPEGCTAVGVPARVLPRRPDLATAPGTNEGQ